MMGLTVLDKNLNATVDDYIKVALLLARAEKDIASQQLARLEVSSELTKNGLLKVTKYLDARKDGRQKLIGVVFEAGTRVIFSSGRDVGVKVKGSRFWGFCRREARVLCKEAVADKDVNGK